MVRRTSSPRYLQTACIGQKTKTMIKVLMGAIRPRTNERDNRREKVERRAWRWIQLND